MAANGSYASGTWFVTKGREDEFVEVWTDFLRLAHESGTGFRSAKLLRDDADPSHFVSVAEFDDDAARDHWREHPDFTEGLKACMALCDDTTTGLYALAATG